MRQNMQSIVNWQRFHRCSGNLASLFLPLPPSDSSLPLTSSFSYLDFFLSPGYQVPSCQVSWSLGSCDYECWFSQDIWMSSTQGWSRRSHGDHDLALTFRNEGNGLITGMTLLPFCLPIQSESECGVSPLANEIVPVYQSYRIMPWYSRFVFLLQSSGSQRRKSKAAQGTQSRVVLLWMPVALFQEPTCFCFICCH